MIDKCISLKKCSFQILGKSQCFGGVHILDGSKYFKGVHILRVWGGSKYFKGGPYISGLS